MALTRDQYNKLDRFNRLVWQTGFGLALAVPVVTLMIWLT